MPFEEFSSTYRARSSATPKSGSDEPVHPGGIAEPDYCLEHGNRRVVRESRLRAAGRSLGQFPLVGLALEGCMPGACGHDQDGALATGRSHALAS